MVSSAHAALEAYSVLTRLPPPHRAPAGLVVEFLSTQFSEPYLVLTAAASRALVQETAKNIYCALGCRGLSRVDMFLKEDGDVVLNEVNTLPGLTSYSRYPRMMAAAGFPFAEVIDRMVSMTLTENGR